MVCHFLLLYNTNLAWSIITFFQMINTSNKNKTVWNKNLILIKNIIFVFSSKKNSNIMNSKKGYMICRKNSPLPKYSLCPVLL